MPKEPKIYDMNVNVNVVYFIYRNKSNENINY